MGINIALVSKSEEKLYGVLQEIKELCGNSVEYKAFPINFTRGVEVYPELQKELEDLDIGILINNEKLISQPNFEYFIELSNSKNHFIEMLNCNVLSVTRMTGIVLPKMLQKGKGVIVNVGSIPSKIDSPFMALHGSTNAFVEKFTMDMAQEYKDKGIIFQSLTPGTIVSNTKNLEASTILFPTSEAFVNKALKTIGKQTQTSRCISHQLIDNSFNFVNFVSRKRSSEAATKSFKQLWLQGKRKFHKKLEGEKNCEKIN
ncbi:unnamed protein product [Orchesella dallaii]|uniref:Uncharacterized protein n=1 Tax=Orchesella dallaii TaxID=48710 RepID=A0ABP1Q3H0_9HEXA